MEYNYIGKKIESCVPDTDSRMNDWFDRKFIKPIRIIEPNMNYVYDNGVYHSYILFAEKEEYLFFHRETNKTEQESLISKIHEILEPLEVYGEIMKIDDIVLTLDQVEFYKNCSVFFNREIIFYKTNDYEYEKPISETNDEKVERVKAKYTALIRGVISSYDTMKTHFSIYAKNNKNQYSKSDYYVLYNIPQKVCMVIDDGNVSRDMWTYIKDFVVGESACIKHFISYFHMKTFESFDEVKKYMEMLESTLDIKKPIDVINEQMNEKAKVVSYIKTNYDITDSTEPEFCKKSEDLFNEIQTYLPDLPIDNTGIYQFRIRLSKYLQELGIKKKRFTNGYYYYGMTPKYSKYIKQDLTNINLQELEESRDKELREILNSTNGKTINIRISSMSYNPDEKQQNRDSKDILPMEHVYAINELDSIHYSVLKGHNNVN
jgi:phage anti-repressor protein